MAANFESLHLCPYYGIETIICIAIAAYSEVSPEEIIEVKTSLPVTVSIESSESEVLYEYTRTLFRNFNPSVVASHTLCCGRDRHDGDQYECEVLPVQEWLYQRVRNAEGVSIIPPKLTVSSSEDERHSNSSSKHSEVNSAFALHNEYQCLNVDKLEKSTYERVSISPLLTSSGSDVYATSTRELMSQVQINVSVEIEKVDLCH